LVISVVGRSRHGRKWPVVWQLLYPLRAFSSAVTRRIWGSPEAILLFFAGGTAEATRPTAVKDALGESA
jgi:hypothetical protein